MNSINTWNSVFNKEWNKVLQSIESGHHFDNVSKNLIEEYVNKHMPLVYEIINNINFNKHNKILETGFGRGLIATFLSYNKKITVHGLEKNPGYVKLALETSNHFNGNLNKDNFVLGDALDIELDNKFDIVYSQGFIHHFSNEKIKEYLDKYLELSPIIIFSVPSYYHPFANVGYKEPTGFFNINEVERFLTIEEWKEILKDYKTEIFYYDHASDISPEIIKDMSICGTIKKQKA